MTVGLTLDDLDAGETKDGREVTPEMIFEDDKGVPAKKTLKSLDADLDKIVAGLPPPKGVDPQVVRDLKEPQIDLGLYRYKELVEKIKREPILPKVATGVEELDELLDGGLQAGELMVLSAPTKQGKTSMCQTMSYLQATRDIPSVFFSLEMSWQELTRKYTDMDWEMAAINEPADLMIYYPMDTRSVSLEWLEQQIKKAQEEHAVRVVYVDHLHFLIPMEVAKRNVSLYIGHVVRTIKQMAVNLNIPIVLIAHTTKLRGEDVPDISSPRDSSFIVQEADFLLLLWRERHTKSQKEKKMGIPDEGEEIFTGVTWAILEANRRNGKARRWKMGMINGRFHSWVEHEHIKSETTSQEQVAKMRDENEMLTGMKKQMEEAQREENEKNKQKPLI